MPASFQSRRCWAGHGVRARAKVEGDTSHEIISRIILRHINEVKYCYQLELLRQPTLAGRIQVRFTVAASGQVIAADVERSTIGDARVEDCTVAAIRRLQFPKPLEGRQIIISYPFVLTPEPGTRDAGAARD